MGPSSVPPSATTPGNAVRPKRPWFLTLALSVAWFMGAYAVLWGAAILSVSPNVTDEYNLEVDRKDGITEEERTRQKEAFSSLAATVSAAKNRVTPLYIAQLLVGAAMVIFSQRAMAGRAWARRALIQLTAVHIALTAVEWQLMPDIRASLTEVMFAQRNLDAKEARVDANNPLTLVMSLSIGALTVLGLTARRSRAFYELV